MTRPDTTRPADAIDAYLDGEPTPEQAAALERWIQSDPANAAAFLADVQLHQQIAQRMGRARLHRKLDRAGSVVESVAGTGAAAGATPGRDRGGRGSGDRDKGLASAAASASSGSSGSSMIAAQVLEALREIDAQADHAPPVDLDRELDKLRQENTRRRRQRPSMSAREIADSLGYLAVQAMRTRPGVLSAAAAVALLVLVGAIWLTGPRQGATPTAEPGPPAASPYAVTLTDQRGAQWASNDLSLGDTLAAGQTLTLASGLAELTTERGAKAVLQGPCTVELIERDNGLRLHEGRLVGICETPSAKGFAVLTPRLDVIDLGTRFGVEAWANGDTQVHVLEGEVTVYPKTADSPAAHRQTLTAGQAVATSAGQPKPAPLTSRPDRFAMLDRRTIPLTGTGQGLAVGEADPRWRIVAVDGQPLEQPALMRVSKGLHTRGTEPNDPAVSQYLQREDSVQPDRKFSGVGERIRYTVQTTVDLPESFDPSASRLHLRFEVDDQLLAVRLNGHEVKAPANSHTDDDLTMNAMTIDGRHLLPGNNTVTFEVSDLVRNSGPVWGMRIAWHLETPTTRGR